MNDIQNALADCRAAWAAHPEATWGWCVHHSIEIEPLNKPINERIDYILQKKASKERVCRLNNLRPVLSPLPKLSKALAEADDKLMKAIESACIAYKEYKNSRRSCEDAYQKALADGLGFEAACIAYRQAYQNCNFDAHATWLTTCAVSMKSLIAEYRKICGWSAEELQPLHRADVPHHTWNGKSIF